MHDHTHEGCCGAHAHAAGHDDCCGGHHRVAEHAEHHHHHHDGECCGHHHDGAHGHDECCGHHHAAPSAAELDVPGFTILGVSDDGTVSFAPEAPVEFDFSIDGLRLHGRRWGDASQTPVVLLHGFMQSSASWGFAPLELSEEHCVYALDLVGHGKSDRPDDATAYDYDAVADAVAAFLDKVACVSPVDGSRRKAHVLGYSMGGRIALAVMARHPELLASVMLESCGLGPADEDERAEARQRNEGWARRLREEGMEAFVDYWEGLDLFASQRERGFDARQRPGRVANDAEAMARCVERAGKHVMPLEQEALDALGFTWLPILYICGSSDASASRVAHALSHCGVQVVEAQTGHNVHLEAPMLYLREVKQFMSGIELKGVFPAMAGVAQKEGMES